ncbi:hypothetical protein MAR_014265 [Mya arenaria]|uniref:Uncharacterized protein n=1 Tax=Mya arenaria TaxID=6604 RepID=A0ABY7G691_MYAAR|nr:hypothetical protein MAR_014265 [Mya arenaria]
MRSLLLKLSYMFMIHNLQRSPVPRSDLSIVRYNVLRVLFTNATFLLQIFQSLTRDRQVDRHGGILNGCTTQLDCTYAGGKERTTTPSYQTSTAVELPANDYNVFTNTRVTFLSMNAKILNAFRAHRCISQRFMIVFRLREYLHSKL